MNVFLTFPLLIVLLTAPAVKGTAEIASQDRSAIDQIIGAKGTYVSDDATYKVVLPREAATSVQKYQTLSSNLGLNSWAAFTSAIHDPAALTGEFLLLDDEVNPVLSAALEAGLEVTGLAVSSVFDGPRLHTLNVTGRGSFQTLAAAFRKGLDEIVHVRHTMVARHVKSTHALLQFDSAIDGRPLDAILSMRGTTVAGVYKAAIGKRAILHGELISREMGITTWVSFSGKNEHAMAQGEFVEVTEDLQNVLKALRAREIYVESIRNHTLGEHPQFVFIRYWGQGPALELAKSIR
jgi:hypothetical protein